MNIDDALETPGEIRRPRRLTDAELIDWIREHGRSRPRLCAAVLRRRLERRDDPTPLMQALQEAHLEGLAA